MELILITLYLAACLLHIYTSSFIFNKMCKLSLCVCSVSWACVCVSHSVFRKSRSPRVRGCDDSCGDCLLSGEPAESYTCGAGGDSVSCSRALPPAEERLLIPTARSVYSDIKPGL